MPYQKFFTMKRWSTSGLVTARKQSLGQGNIFRSVCQEFCSQGGSTRPGTPWEQVHPPDQVHPPGPGTPPDQVHPCSTVTKYTPWDQVHPPGPVNSPRRGTPQDHVHPLGPGTSHWSSACWEIQATSGWYASYWNAFL